MGFLYSSLAFVAMTTERGKGRGMVRWEYFGGGGYLFERCRGIHFLTKYFVIQDVMFQF
jgi:hypothetical protein